MKKKYVISFFASVFLTVLALLFFISWMNPDRIIHAPWGIDFVSDRNFPYKKFSILKDNTNYTDLVVGSSTSETFTPEIIYNEHNIRAQLASTGEAKTPFRYAQINYALENNPNLKRILYFVDLFEFIDLDLGSTIFYQKEIMDRIDPDIRQKLKRPDIMASLENYFSEPVLKSAFHTFLDYLRFKRGKYKSEFKSDGTTSHSLVIVNRKENIESRVLRTAHAYEGDYKNIKDLDPVTIELFHRIIEKARSKNVEVVFVITPWHTLFYKYFESDLKRHGDVYTKWVEFIKSLRSESVRVVDYSYPLSLEKGISDDPEYWGDGIHFGVKSAEIILNEIYGR